MKSDLLGGERLASLEARPKSELPEQGDQPVADVGRIVGIALKLGLEGLFLEDCPHGEQHAEQGDS